MYCPSLLTGREARGSPGLQEWYRKLASARLFSRSQGEDRDTHQRFDPIAFLKTCRREDPTHKDEQEETFT
jgi:hypothetical protein